ncbi:MAG TPA: PQQ-binding-like beta-propeller repeat protein [Acetobacteraceae bacterium]|nr:PQQ-binding-like beta-propeller repeat protein [Acetobacteraceae bacterium]
MKRSTLLATALTTGLLLGAAGAARAASWDDLVNAGSQAKNWLTYGGNLAQTRYWPSHAINTHNVGQLRVKWVFQTGVLGSFENSPIVEDGVMYITTPYNYLFAVDARTGKELWHYQQKLAAVPLCCGPNSRGVALLGDTLFMATLDASLVALNKKTGEKLWETQVADPEMGYSLTMAPVIYKDKVIVGMGGAEYGIRGMITAYNVKDGSQAWRWYTVPSPDDEQPDGTKGWIGNYVEKVDGVNDLHRDIAAEKAAAADPKNKDAWMHGGASNWMTDTIDVKRGMLFASLGNPSPDLDGSVRPGDNRWSDSLVALNADTGEMIWGYQYVPHDVWDLDATSPPILATAPDRHGHMRDVVITGGKTGWVYVHDRASGALLRRSPNMIPHENLFAQPTEAGVRMLPGANGGVEWSPGAYDPMTHDVYYLNLHQPMTYQVKPEPWEKGALWLAGAFTSIPGEAQWGRLVAVNTHTGKIDWAAKTENPMIGGAMTTAGGLVFAGEGNGEFKAYDARTGKVLWQFQAGAGVNAAPVAFEVDGKPYIAVAAGGNFQLKYKLGDAVYVFGL